MLRFDGRGRMALGNCPCGRQDFAVDVAGAAPASTARSAFTQQQGFFSTGSLNQRVERGPIENKWRITMDVENPMDVRPAFSRSPVH